MNAVKNFLFYTGSATMAISLPTSRGFIVVGGVIFMAGLLLSFYDFRQKSFSIEWLKDSWRNKEAQPFLILILPFLLLLISGLYSEDLNPWLTDIRVEIIALFIPLAALYYGKVPKKAIQILQVLFIASCLVSGLYSIIEYAMHYEEVNEAIGKGQYLPHLIDPIRLSLMFSMSCIMAFVMYLRRNYLYYNWEPYVYLVFSLLLFVIVHLFSVRTGIVTTYASIGFLLLYFMVKNFRAYHLIILLLIALLPYLAYLFIPSFHNKIHYMLYDWRQMEKKDAGQYSDSNRLISFEVGRKIYEESAIIGHGSGDVERKVEEYYHKLYPNIDKVLRPHNQYISIAIESGVIGLLTFIISLLFPLARGRWRSNILFPVFILQIAMSCLVENTIDNNVGLSYYLFWTCIFLIEWRSTK